MDIKPLILKKLDSLLGPVLVVLVRLFVRARSFRSEKISSILFIRPGGIGDAVLLLPAIDAIKKACPDSTIDVLAEKRNSEIFSLSSSVNRVFLYDTPTELLAAIRGSYDVVIDTEQWYRLSAVIAYLTRAPQRTGFATNIRELLFTQKVDYRQYDYEAENFLKLVAPIVGDVKFDGSKPIFSVPEKESEKAATLLKPISDRKIIAIFPGGSVEEKRWRPERFHETAGMLIEKGFSVVVIGGMKDVTDGNEVADGLTYTINLCGSLTLIETAAILKEATLLITGDSGIMHVACGLGTGTLSLFGPGSDIKWAPKGRNHSIINKKLGCSPCTRFGHTPRCKIGIKCMREIKAKEVYYQATKMLER